MKLILSRKGFDSGDGGVASPILPDGRMISLPVTYSHSRLKYSGVRWDGGDLGAIVRQLTKGRIKPSRGAHLDPDLRRDALKRKPGWRQLFG
jgi:putative DNA base modification enzyme with NMAD domain